MDLSSLLLRILAYKFRMCMCSFTSLWYKNNPHVLLVVSVNNLDLHIVIKIEPMLQILLCILTA